MAFLCEASGNRTAAMIGSIESHAGENDFLTQLLYSNRGKKTTDLMESQVPSNRIRVLHERPKNPSGQFVLYWMTAFRRTQSNFALQHAINLAEELSRPLMILEALRVRYRWACDRFHRFIIRGMLDNQNACHSANVFYFPYVEPKPSHASGLVQRLSQDACVIVADDYPCFFHPRMVQRLDAKLTVRMELVDSNGLMPLSVAEKTFTVAHSYRRWMQKTLPDYLVQMPLWNPLHSQQANRLPALHQLPNDVEEKWPAANLDSLLAPNGLSMLPINHRVSGGAAEGGSTEADRLLCEFTGRRLESYAADRNVPDKLGSSELSPHLHFGHISAHQIFVRVMESQDWNPGKLQTANGKVHGFWGVDGASEAFLDQLCTWREIGFNMCWREPDYAKLSSLPSWALKTIREHASDSRDTVYSLHEFENAQTHDEIWNAAQRQLVQEGRIHNYLRMLWGKKILHWTNSAQEALAVMIELNNKYALDGRDPNSYSGIFWVLGRYDRAWGPERPIFGKIRYMTSASTAKKHKLGKYLRRFANPCNG